MQQLQDEDIINMVLQGDKKAYALLIERYQHFVFTLIKRIINNHEDAEELTQDVFIKAFHALGDYKGTSKFSTWLYTIARNISLSYMRKQKAAIVSDEILTSINGYSRDTEQSLEKKNRKAVINNAINHLEPSEAQVLTLFYIQEQTIDEIAIILDMNPGNVKVKLFRSRKKLKEILNRDYKNEFSEYRNTTKDLS